MGRFVAVGIVALAGVEVDRFVHSGVDYECSVAITSATGDLHAWNQDVKDVVAKTLETEFKCRFDNVIKDGENVYFIPLAEIRFIESMDNYARLYFGNEKAMVKRSLNQLEEKLDPNTFFRANRSQIINTEYIDEIHPYFNNKLKIVLTSGESVEVSSRQSVKFKKRNSL